MPSTPRLLSVILALAVCLRVSAIAAAEEAVLPIPLPKDGAVAPEHAGKLPIRLTVTWNVATRQAKCYVGQTFCGIMDQGGLASSREKVRQVMAIGTRHAEIDADGMLPWPKFIKALQMLRSARLDSISFAAPQEMPVSRFAGPAPGTLDGWSWPKTPMVDEAEKPLTKADKAIVVGIDHHRHFAVATGAGDEPRALAGPAFHKWLRLQAALVRDPDHPKLSARKVVFRMAADAQWHDLVIPLIDCAKVGIWDLYIAVRVPTTLTVTVAADGSCTLGEATFAADAADGLQALLAERVVAAGGPAMARLIVTGPMDASADAVSRIESMGAKLGIERRQVTLGK